MSVKQKYMAYVGTYTGNGSKGIYTFEMDEKTGDLSPVENPVKINNPSYLAVDRNNRYLYSVMEIDTFYNQPGGAVAAFSIDRYTGGLKLINYQPTKGKSPGHLSVDSKNQCVFVANYEEGTVTVLPVRPDGGLDALSSVLVHQGSGPNPVRQEKPHAHFVTLTPDEKYLCAVDLGIDQVVVYNYDPLKGVSSASCFSAKIMPGSGPRHMEFHPNGRFAYVVTELSSEIVVLKYHTDGLLFEAIQTISTLPREYSGTSYCAAVHVSPDGNFLYASNRGHDSIAIFRIDPLSGMVEEVAHCLTYGIYPRDFAIDPMGKFLFAANQDSNSIVPFAVINKTGRLEKLDGAIHIPNPVCIKFAILTV